MGEVMDKFEGQEGNIKFSVDPRATTIFIMAENIETNKKEEFLYTCEYPSLFGFDCMDVENVNRKLDKMIEAVR